MPVLTLVRVDHEKVSSEWGRVLHSPILLAAIDICILTMLMISWSSNIFIYFLIYWCVQNITFACHY